MGRPWETDEERDELARDRIRKMCAGDGDDVRYDKLIDMLGLNGRPVRVRYDKLGLSRSVDKRRIKTKPSDKG